MELTTPIRYIEDDGCTCPNCGASTLYLLSGDVDISQLSREGILLSTKNIKHQSAIICLQCRHKYDYTRKGIFIVPIFPGGLNSGSNIKDAKRINEHNPFSI